MNSAFNRDGSLRPAYTTRVARVVEAADRLGAFVILSAFYQRQHSHDRAIASRTATRDAIIGVARWIAGRGDANVLLEVSNEYRHAGFARWADGEWLRSVEGQVDLIRHAKAAAPRLLVSTSGMGDGTMPDAIADAADFLLIHLNTTPLEAIPRAVRRARRHGKPVVVNEDDNMGEAGAEAARIAVEHGAGWGFMHRAKNQSVPFEYEGAADDPAVYAMIRRLTTPPAAGNFPPPDVDGGWRRATDEAQRRQIAGMSGGQKPHFEMRDTGLEVHPDAARAARPRDGWTQTVDDRTAVHDTLRKVLAAIDRP